MKRAPLSATSLVILAACVLAACSDLQPGQRGPFSNGAVAGGQLTRATTVTSAESMATGSTGGTAAAATIVILAKHQATARQQAVARAHARTAMAKLRARHPQATTPPTSSMSRKTGDTTRSSVPRYIAVDTASDERTAPQAQKSVVIFDTETQEIVGNNVYDVKAAPPVGGSAKFETYTAEYVGSGF